MVHFLKNVHCSFENEEMTAQHNYCNHAYLQYKNHMLKNICPFLYLKCNTISNGFFLISVSKNGNFKIICWSTTFYLIIFHFTKTFIFLILLPGSLPLFHFIGKTELYFVAPHKSFFLFSRLHEFFMGYENSMSCWNSITRNVYEVLFLQQPLFLFHKQITLHEKLMFILRK